MCPHVHNSVEKSFVHVPIMGFRKFCFIHFFSMEVSGAIPWKYRSWMTLYLSNISPRPLMLDCWDSFNGGTSMFFYI